MSAIQLLTTNFGIVAKGQKMWHTLLCLQGLIQRRILNTTTLFTPWRGLKIITVIKMIQMRQTNVLKIQVQINRILIHIQRTFNATAVEEQVINTKTKALGLPWQAHEKPGCDEWYEYLKNKGWLSWNTSENTTNNTTDEVHALAITTMVHPTSNHILAAVNSSLNKRTVAITTDISFKGKQTWFNNEKTILDLSGCENLINLDFVKI